MATNTSAHFIVALLLAGCGMEDPALPIEGGMAASVRRCPGSSKALFRSEQGRSLQGLQGSSFVMLGATIDCESVEDLHLEGARLVGRIGGRVVSGEDFAGADLSVRDLKGQVATVKIAQVETDAADTSGETSLYALQYVDLQSGALKDVCEADKSGVSKAMPFLGSWDAAGAKVPDNTAITFGCTSGVLAKCARWGYRPWQSYRGVPLAPYHQACTRMARADYCGNGTSYTQDGTTVDIYDKLALLKKTVDFADFLLLFEGTWTPDGAYCVAKERWLSLSTLLDPSCRKQFKVAAESSPVDSSDVCYSRRTDLKAEDALISNRSYVRAKL